MRTGWREWARPESGDQLGGHSAVIHGRDGKCAGKGAVKVAKRTWLPAACEGRASNFTDGLDAGCVRAAVGFPRMPGLAAGCTLLCGQIWFWMWVMIWF